MTYVFDALNRVTSVTSPGPKTVSYTYDNLGNRSRITYPDSKYVDYTYDAAGGLATVTDWLAKETSYAYNLAGALVTTTLPSSTGITSTRTYDNAGRLTEVENAQGTTILSSFRYTLNAAGLRTQIIDLTGTTTFGYDDLYRLTSASYPGPSTDTYTYDEVGNRATKNSTSYTYDDADQMTAVGGVSYGYDANGNQTSRASDTFTFDHENRMMALSIGGAGASYTYNGDGVRVSKSAGGVTTNYVQDVVGGLPMVVQDGTYTYVYGIGLISITDGVGVQTYRLTDGLGSTTEIVDGSGNTIVSYTYDAFGAVRTQSASSANDWLFTGEQRDDESGLDFLRARYYDHTIGRFLSRDTAGQGSNDYGYALGNPVSLVDPSGLWTVCQHWVLEGEVPICAQTREIGDVLGYELVWDYWGCGCWLAATNLSEWHGYDWIDVAADIGAEIKDVVTLGYSTPENPEVDGRLLYQPFVDGYNWLADCGPCQVAAEVAAAGYIFHQCMGSASVAQGLSTLPIPPQAIVAGQLGVCGSVAVGAYYGGEFALE